MSLGALELSYVIPALDKDLRGAVVRKVLCPALPGRLCLELRTQCENHFLLAVVHGDATRLHRVGTKPRNADEPHPFVMLLRKELVGLAVASVRQLGGDRVVELCFRGGERCASLVCELTSKHSNLFFISGEGRIGGSLYPNRSQRRALVPGQCYEPPASHEGKRPEINRFDSSLPMEPQIEARYAASDATAELEQKKSMVSRLLRTARQKLERLLTALEGDLSRASQADELSTFGHLLKANLKRLSRGASSAALEGFDGAKVDVPLDPRLGPVENMEKFFDKARRLRKAMSFIEKRMDETLDKLAEIEQFEQALPSADAAELEEILQTVCRKHKGLRPKLPSNKREPQERLPYKEIPISAGRFARVGRSARDNDALTLRHTRPDDLWLHVRGRPGSHVVVPMGRLEEPSFDILVDAAHLAVHFSLARGQSGVEVIYTRRRYVAKPRGAAPGSVRIMKEKTLLLELEPERLARLLGKADIDGQTSW
ncbi:MAG: NFACT RNA binding domain-containing protein [Myxococcota bacterium]|jgi:predicted ribosome quality control (RQC) complex YloA/Tae2 family protein|nr:NFACT RNA binding domain-containing protein [Myxococcota bacterium]